MNIKTKGLLAVVAIVAIAIAGPWLDRLNMPSFWALREAWRRRHLFCIAENINVAAIVLWRDLATSTEYAPGVIPRPIVRRIMTFSNRSLNRQFLTGTRADMEELLRGQHLERASFFVPFSSRVNGTFEEQAALCPSVTLDQARRLVRRYGR